MARKDEFIQELATQVKSLKDWYDELSIQTAQHKLLLVASKTRRDTLMNDYAASLLPDLAQSSIARMERRFPEVISFDIVSHLLADDHAAIQAQLDAMPAPNTFDLAAEGTLDRALRREQSILESAESAFKEMNDIEGLAKLIKANYDTRSYQQSWLSIQYYRDWKRADEIVSELGFRDWNEVREQYETRTKVYEVEKRNTDKLKRDLTAIVDNRKRLADLTQALNEVPVVALEKLQMKLKATFENETPPDDIKRMDTQTAKTEANLKDLQEQKQKVSEKITRLMELRTKVSKSPRPDVPDEYLRHVQLENRTVQQTVYVQHHDDWLTNYLYYSTMMNMFDHQSSSHRPASYESETDHVPAPRGDHYGSV